MCESSAKRSETALRHTHSSLEISQVQQLGWKEYDRFIEAIIQANEGRWSKIYQFDYQHSVDLQDEKNGIGKPYSVPITYSDSGGVGEPVVAIGGLTNVFQRFDFLAMDGYPDVRLIAVDLVGRGRSGWMSEISDYNLETYVEQILQLLDFLKLDSVSLLGSSLGGTIAISIAARCPSRVKRIILNDIGPYIPKERRARRAVSLARHFVFHSPSELFRRTGAAVKHTGPAPDAVLLHTNHHKTSWSNTENGRVYRHDLRCLLAYRKSAVSSLDQWHEWNEVQCPVLLLHGMQSDATPDSVVDRMREHRLLSVVQIEGTGHTPNLADRPLIESIALWVRNDDPFDKDKFYRVQYNPKRILYPS